MLTLKKLQAMSDEQFGYLIRSDDYVTLSILKQIEKESALITYEVTPRLVQRRNGANAP
jgi:hypothetical protein